MLFLLFYLLFTFASLAWFCREICSAWAIHPCWYLFSCLGCNRLNVINGLIKSYRWILQISPVQAQPTAAWCRPSPILPATSPFPNSSNSSMPNSNRPRPKTSHSKRTVLKMPKQKLAQKAWCNSSSSCQSCCCCCCCCWKIKQCNLERFLTHRCTNVPTITLLDHSLHETFCSTTQWSWNFTATQRHSGHAWAGQCISINATVTCEDFRCHSCVPDISAIGTMRSGRHLKRKTTTSATSSFRELNSTSDSNIAVRESHWTIFSHCAIFQFGATFQSSSARSKKISAGWSIDSSMRASLGLKKWFTSRILPRQQANCGDQRGMLEIMPGPSSKPRSKSLGWRELSNGLSMRGSVLTRLKTLRIPLYTLN